MVLLPPPGRITFLPLVSLGTSDVPCLLPVPHHVPYVQISRLTSSCIGWHGPVLPATLEAEAGGSQIQCPLGQTDNLVRSFLMLAFLCFTKSGEIWRM